MTKWLLSKWWRYMRRYTQRNQRRASGNDLLHEFCRRTESEEDVRAALIGPDKAGTGETVTGITAPAFSALLCAPVLELADRRGLQPRAHSGRPGPIPGWGTITSAADRNRCDNSTKWRKNPSRSAKRVNPDQPRSV